MRCAVFLPMPGARESAVTSPVTIATDRSRIGRAESTPSAVFAPDARHLTELFKHGALLPGGETEQLHRVLAHVQHRVAAPFFALRGRFRQRCVGAHQKKADAARADDQLARRFAFDRAFNKIDHDSLT